MICPRCQGLLIAERVLEFYEPGPRWRCVSRPRPEGSSSSIQPTEADHHFTAVEEARTMKRTGRLIRSIRVPALIQGELTALDFPPLGGRWSALCFPSTFELVESVFLDRQTRVFEREDAALFAVVPSEGTIRESWCRQFGTLRIPLLADPLRRLAKPSVWERLILRPSARACSWIPPVCIAFT